MVEDSVVDSWSRDCAALADSALPSLRLGETHPMQHSCEAHGSLSERQGQGLHLCHGWAGGLCPPKARLGPNAPSAPSM